MFKILIYDFMGRLFYKNINDNENLKIKSMECCKCSKLKK